MGYYHNTAAQLPALSFQHCTDPTAANNVAPNWFAFLYAVRSWDLVVIVRFFYYIKVKKETTKKNDPVIPRIGLLLRSCCLKCLNNKTNNYAFRGI